MMRRGLRRCLEDWRLGAVLSMVTVFCSLFAVFLVVELIHADAVSEAGIKRLAFSKENNSVLPTRKLLQSTDNDEGNRLGTACSKDDVTISQGATTPLPSGIPEYTVQILNACVSGCSVSNVHVSCGWFSSARLINPRVFKRVYYDDCLVNGGEAIGPGETLSFQYANSFPYAMSVSSVTCG